MRATDHATRERTPRRGVPTSPTQLPEIKMRSSAEPTHSRWTRLLPLAPLVFLWFILINQLRGEWTVNPQYSYGWVVPVLCAGLAWKRWGGGTEQENLGQAPPVTGRPPIPSLSRATAARSVRGAWFRGALPAFWPWLFAGCALLYAPTRLIQEANPEWRLVSWLLALEVVGLTLLVAGLGPEVGGQKSEFSGQGSEPTVDLRPLSSVLWFPLCFFLVAVPWPTLLEGPLVQGLTRADARLVVEALGWLGVPAVQQGNVIQVRAGTVGLDEACSGIRSFQSSLMVSLFLGELYRLTAPRRAVLCLSGFALAFLFNVARTFALTWVAARQGTAAIATWHDPAGFSILVACVAGLWLLSLLLKGRRPEVGSRRSGRRDRGPLTSDLRPLTSDAALRPLPCPLRAASLGLLVWLVVVEAGVATWYRVHEWRLPRSAAWSVRAPRDEPEFAALPLADKTRQLLRYDEAMSFSWREGTARWQLIYLRWKPGRIAVHLATSHTPEVCWPAAGRKWVSTSDLKFIKVRGLQLPFRCYVMEEAGRPIHVFYCLWEDRASDPSFQTEALTYGNRLGPVLAGRRNAGERSLELAVWGIDDAPEAEAAVQRQLENLVDIGNGR